LFERFNKWFDNITEHYKNGVNRVSMGHIYHHPAGRALYRRLLPVREKAYRFIPSEDDGNLYVTFQLPPASATVQSVDVMQRLMKVVTETPGVAHYAALSGLNVVNNATNSNAGTIYVQLKPWDERSEESQQVPGIIDVMQKRILDAGIKNANVEVIPPSPIPGVGATVGFSLQLEQRSTNDNFQAFQKVVTKFIDEANHNPAISGAYSFYSANTPSFNLKVDRDKCEKLGVNVGDVFTTIQAFMGSLYINDFTEYNRTFHVVVQADTNFRAVITDMNKYYVRNQDSTMVPLSTLVTYTPTEAPPLVSHFNIFRSAEIDGAPATGYSSTQATDSLIAIANRVLPQGYNYEFSGLSYEEIRQARLRFIFLFSITFVFLFLAALYESWSVPFSVLLAVPVGAFGAILTLTLCPA
jgi:HAE1 family hydrophobic/amphiphilic exporter-1